MMFKKYFIGLLAAFCFCACNDGSTISTGSDTEDSGKNTKGIISLLIGVYSGRTAREIAEDDFSFIERLGLRENLSPTRANGLASMVATIRETAKNHV